MASMRHLRSLVLTVTLALPLAAGCAAPTEEAAASPEGNEDEIVKAIRLEELAPGSKLRTQVEEQDQTWGDENIMNGSVGVIARKVTAKSRLDLVAKAALGDRNKYYEVVVKAKVTTKAGEPTATLAKEAARRIAVEGFVYADNRGNVGPVEKSVNALVAALGAEGDIEAAVAETRVTVDSGDDSTWRASAFVFANKKTGELLVFYAREGWV